MAKKSYAYAQLEAVALEMRKNKDMVFFYEYETPVATLPTGEVLDLAKEFGNASHVRPRLGDRRKLDRRRRDRRGRGRFHRRSPLAVNDHTVRHRVHLQSGR